MNERIEPPQDQPVGEIAPLSDAASPPPPVVATPSPRKFKRKLTPFLAQEMLYDFATHQLDDERRTAVDDFVSGDRECQNLLEGIRTSLDFTERLSHTVLVDETLALLRESENVVSLGKRYSKWGSWPDSMRWSIVAVTVSACVAMVVATVPWQKIRMNSAVQTQENIEVAKIPAPSSDQLKTLQETNEADPTAQETSGDEADVADNGSGDNEDSGDAMDASPTGVANAGAEKSSAAQAVVAAQAAATDRARLAAEAKAEEAARKTNEAALERAESARAASDEAAVSPVAGSEPERRPMAPTLLARQPLPMMSNLMAAMLEVPRGFIPSQLDVQKKISAPMVVAHEPEPVKTLPSEPADREEAAAKTEPVPEAAAPVVQAESPAQANAATAPMKPSQAPDTTTVTASAAAASATLAKANAAASANEKNTGKPQGYVYRAFMTLDDLDTLGPKISQLVQELGGVKAGEVELGWKKGNSVRYYHFSIPQANQEKLLEQLQTYGPVRLSKDSHPRIMPKGQVRFILWVEAPKAN